MKTSLQYVSMYLFVFFMAWKMFDAHILFANLAASFAMFHLKISKEQEKWGR